jgi:hypothetical protein
MVTSQQSWFGYGSILWWAYLAITAAVLLSCLGLWIYAVRVYPQSHTESDCDNVVDISEQLIGEDRINRAQMKDPPPADSDGVTAEELRTA